MCLTDIIAQKGSILVPYLDDKLYGFSDLEGNVVIKPDFEEVRPFDSLGFADVTNYGLKGKINKKGEWAIPPMGRGYTLKDISNFDGKKMTNVPHLFYVESSQNDLFSIFNTQSKSSPSLKYYKHNRGLKRMYRNFMRFLETQNFEYGLKKVIFKDSSTNLMKLDGSYFYEKNQYDVDVVNDILIAKAYDRFYFGLFDYSDNSISTDTFAGLRISENDEYIIASTGLYEYDYKYFILDRKGQKILPNPFQKVKHLFEDLFYVNNKSIHNVINQKGEVIIPDCDTNVNSICQKYIVQLYKDTLQIINKKGKVMLSIKDGQIPIDIYTKFFRVKVGNITSIYNIDLVKLYEFEGDDIYVQNGYTNSDECIVSESYNRKSNLVSKDGEILLTTDGKIEGMATYEAYLVVQNYKTGVFSSKKGWVFPLSYDQIEFDYKTSSLYITKDSFIYSVDKNFKIQKVQKDIYTSIREIFTKDSLIFYFPNGKQFKTKNDGRRISYFETKPKMDQILFVVRGDNSQVLDTNFNNILPDGYYLNPSRSYINIKNNIYGLVVANGTLIGMVDTKGQWLIPPTIAIDIHKIELGYYLLSNQYSSVLYDNNFKQITVQPYSKVNFLDSDRVGIIVGDYLKPNSFEVYDNNMNKLSDLKFDGYSISLKKYFKYEIENDEKMVCFYRYDFSLDTCLAYDYILIPEDQTQRIIVRRNSLFGVLSHDYKLIVPYLYNNILIKEPFLVLQDYLDNTSLLSKSNKIVSLDSKFESIVQDEDSENYILQNYTTRQNRIVNRDGEIISSFIGDFESKRKGDYNYFKDMMIGYQNYKYYYVNKNTGVIYKK